MSKAQIQDYMINFTKDMDASCSTCHEGGDLTKVSHYKEITNSMVYLSRTFHVECRYCHVGLSDLNEAGEISLAHKRKYSDPMKVPCMHCHTKGTAFKLNAIGLEEKHRQDIKK